MNGHNSDAAKAVLQAQAAVERADEAARSRRPVGRSRVVISPTSNSAAPLPSASPPLRAAVPLGPLGSISAEVLVQRARDSVYVADLQRSPLDDCINADHVRDALADLDAVLAGELTASAVFHDARSAHAHLVMVDRYASPEADRIIQGHVAVALAMLGVVLKGRS